MLAALVLVVFTFLIFAQGEKKFTLNEMDFPVVAKATQLNIFMSYGKIFVGKLLEIKHLGNATFSDVGTTYKACRPDKLRELLPRLDPTINLEFNPYFLDEALNLGLRILEAQITFHKRISESKGAISTISWLSSSGSR